MARWRSFHLPVPQGDSTCACSFATTAGSRRSSRRSPGPSLVTVKAGTITRYEGDDRSCTPEVLTAGQSFVDPGGDHVHILRNEGTVPAETIAVQIVASGAPRKIDMPAPGNCPF